VAVLKFFINRSYVGIYGLDFLHRSGTVGPTCVNVPLSKFLDRLQKNSGANLLLDALVLAPWSFSLHSHFKVLPFG
jgi:hypothetical protein